MATHGKVFEAAEVSDETREFMKKVGFEEVEIVATCEVEPDKIIQVLTTPTVKLTIEVVKPDIEDCDAAAKQSEAEYTAIVTAIAERGAAMLGESVAAKELCGLEDVIQAGRELFRLMLAKAAVDSTTHDVGECFEQAEAELRGRMDELVNGDMKFNKDVAELLVRAIIGAEKNDFSEFLDRQDDGQDD